MSWVYDHAMLLTCFACFAVAAVVAGLIAYGAYTFARDENPWDWEAGDE